MNVLDLLQFRDMFPAAPSVAVIGNAPTVREFRNGDVIDAHDIVVRFNQAQVAGLEAQIGRRTDLLFINAGIANAETPRPSETLRPRCVVCLVSPRRLRRIESGEFAAWLKDTPVVLSFVPDMARFSGIERNTRVTSGTTALFVLLDLFAVERLFVTGFTMFGAVPGGTEKYWEEAPIRKCHDLHPEARILAQLLAEFPGELTATSEVEELMRRYGPERSGRLDVNGRGRAGRRRGVRKWLAEALAWRFLRAGMALRRVAHRS